MNTENQDTSLCLNCEAPLQGPFCSECGQPENARLVGFRDWLGEFFATFLKLDSKLLRTMKHVMFLPGQATIDFGKGKRVPYSSPAKVYIIVSAISIAAMSLHGGMSQIPIASGIDDADSFNQRVQFLFPFINLFSPFATAGVLAVLQRKFFFQLHLAFSLHYWSFLIAVSTPMIFIPPTSIWSLIAFFALCIISSAYLFVAHKRVYVVPMVQRIVICCILLASVLVAALTFGFLLFFCAGMLS